MNTITRHYIDGAFVESHGREVMDIIKPANGQVILGMLSRPPSAHSPLSATRPRKSARRFCAGCTRPRWRALTISRRQWLRNMEA
jgi:acyl-CoA reductase-like NAD-dependent aldehyde dehydrogenase